MVTINRLQPEIAPISAGAGPSTGLQTPGSALTQAALDELVNPAPFSGWAGLFEQVILSLPAEQPEFPSPALADRCLDARQPVAFEEIVLPFIRLGRQRLEATAQANSVKNHFSESCLVTFERHLLKDLAGLAGRALWLEFSLFQANGTFFLKPALNINPARPAEKTNYRRFVARLASKENLRAFFHNYPVLARLLSTRLAFWIEAIATFSQRLQDDRPLLDQTFQVAGSVIKAVQPGLSDPHNGGQQVIGLTFANDILLIYKPRNLAVEVAFQALLNWAGSKLELDFNSIKVLNRDTYGWVEYVRSAPCESIVQLEGYYLRSGVLLGLLYILRGNDYHHQNVIASGEFPCLIDQEGLLYPPPPLLKPTGQAAQANEFSVLHTGFLPVWQVPATGEPYDQSGLAGSGQTLNTATEAPAEWAFLNTDRMQPARKTVVEKKPLAWPHRPALQGTAQPVEAVAYQTELISGFRLITSQLLAERTALLAPDGPLSHFETVPVRFVFRPTQVYHDLLNQALEPKNLRGESERRQVLGRLAKGLEHSANHRQLIEAEIASLEQLDVPLFTVRANERALLLPVGKALNGFFEHSGYALVRQHLQSLTQSEVERQIKYIRASFYSLTAGQFQTGPAFASEAKAPATGGKPELKFDPALAMAAAGRLAQLFKEQAVSGPDGPGWVFMEASRADRFPRPSDFDFGLYSGQAGVALFLAAYSKLTGSPAYRQLALDSWQLLASRLQQASLTAADLNGLGGGFGAGSLVYSLAEARRLLGEPDLIAVAGQVADLAFNNATIEEDTQFDILGGSAGAILGLLALYRQAPGFEILNRLIACGRHLVKNCETGSAWATLDGKYWSGFSHGAAGIAYALLRLYQVWPEPGFLGTARQAIAFERNLYRPEPRNWLGWPGQPETAGSFWNTWCHGAAGIGLARLGGLEVLSDAAILEEINLSLETTLSQPLAGLDHLCCGNFGRFDLLIEAARRLKRPELLQAGRDRAAQILGRPGGFVLSGPHPFHLAGPGLFQGMSGIGYELLRLVQPETLNSVLLWECATPA